MKGGFLGGPARQGSSMMEKKMCVVTGASSGIGGGVAALLAKANAVPVLLHRDSDRGRRAFERLRRINRNVEWIPADLSSPPSVRSFAEQVRARYGKCDVLFNCAGGLQMKRVTTEGGLESMFATNFLGHFLLTNLLFEPLRAAESPRVITVSGSSHRGTAAEGFSAGTIDFDDLQAERRFNFARQSKQVVLAKILFTYELARRWERHGIQACTLCPGLVRTNLVSHLPWYARFYFDLRCILTGAPTPERAGVHLLDLATQPGVNGKYFEVRRGKLREARSSDESYDAGIADRLWETAERLVDQRFVY